MSLRPDARSGRSRSKSPGRARERSRSHTREPQAAGGAASPQYRIAQPSQPYATPANEPITMGNYTDLPPEQRPGYTRPAVPTAQGITYATASNIQYAPTREQFSYSATSGAPNAPTRTPMGGPNVQYATTPQNISYTAKPVVNAAQPSVRRSSVVTTPSYPSPGHAQYTAMPRAPPDHAAAQPVYSPSAAQAVYSPPPMAPPSPVPDHHRGLSISTNTRDPSRKIVEMVPSSAGGINQAPPSPGGRPHGLSVSGHRPERLRMDRLSISGNRPDLQTFSPGGGSPGGLPPPSPLLEAYHGTYQSLSPLPSATVWDDDLDHLPPLDAMSPRASGQLGHSRHHSSFSERSPSPSRMKGKDKLALAAYGRMDPEPSRKKEKRVKIYDATDDALALVEAMSAKSVDVDVLIDILPSLSHDQMLELRIEFKRHCKLQGRGINIAKYIKLKTSGNFGKIAHVTALGRYESEGFWANYWYQSHSSQRELLIEALMGRQNYEIREIKDAFKDKRYGDSLTKCMDKELKADKFRKAILMALEGERQEESDTWEIEHRNRDVDTLYRALNAREGGESAMLSVVLMRSDTHLRDVLRTYERRFQGNFARDALKKSNNLVGEVIAHILNGVINRPARDAMLLHHALMDLIEPSRELSRSSSKRHSSKESSSNKHDRQQRYELLISRLVRLHWDRMHLVRVKSEYEEKYGRVVEEDIEEATKGDFREFCIALCQTSR